MKPDRCFLLLGAAFAIAAIAAIAAAPSVAQDHFPNKPEGFQMLAVISRGHHVIAVPASAKANTLAEWIDEVKRSGKPAAVGVSSIGGTTHLMAEDLGMRASFAVEPIVYRSEAPAVQDLLAGASPGFSGVVARIAAIPDMHLTAAEPEQMRKMMQDDAVSGGRIIKARNVKVEQ